MNEELVLKVVSVPVLVGWLAMLLAPRARPTRWRVCLATFGASLAGKRRPAIAAA